MSATATRQSLADKLSTITGITGFKFRPSTPKMGSAWPLLSDAERGPGEYFAYSWRVIVFLGGDEKTAQSFLDDQLPIVVGALEPEVFVERARPFNFQIDGTEAFGVEILVRSE